LHTRVPAAALVIALCCAGCVWQTLWGGWCVLGPRHSFYFAGDTGYNDTLFKLIGAQFGPFDLAALPIGAYSPRYVVIVSLFVSLSCAVSSVISDVSASVSLVQFAICILNEVCWMPYHSVQLSPFYPHDAMLAQVMAIATCLPVCHAPVLCQNEEEETKKRRYFFTIW